MRPQTIQIYLPNGDPQGLRIAELTTRTMQVFDVPRTDMEQFFQFAESQQVALYFLIGEDEEATRPSCYVGQTNSSQQRFKNHLSTKHFWTHALVAVSRTNTLTGTHAGFLEWRAIKEANKSGRFTLENGNAGSRPHTPAPLQAECEEIFETIDTLLSTLGYPLFEPLATASPKATDIAVVCKSRGADARGVYSSDGLTVFAGSRCAEKPTAKATPESIKTVRQKLLGDGTLVMHDGVPVFARDTRFKTPSGAAQVVIFRSANGWTEWRQSNGTTLSEAADRFGNVGGGCTDD